MLHIKILPSEEGTLILIFSELSIYGLMLHFTKHITCSRLTILRRKVHKKSASLPFVKNAQYSRHGRTLYLVHCQCKTSSQILDTKHYSTSKSCLFYVISIFYEIISHLLKMLEKVLKLNFS